MKEQEKNNMQTEDVREFAEMLNGLSGSEKAQVKGIVIGLKIARDAAAAAAGSIKQQVMQTA